MSQQVLILCATMMALVVVEISAAIARHNDRSEEQSLRRGQKQSLLQELLPLYGAMLALIACVAIPTALLHQQQPANFDIVHNVALFFMAFTGGIVLGTRKIMTPCMILASVRIKNKSR